MAFGVIFDFGRGNPINITTAANLIKEKWFQDAVKKDPIDLFVLIGHNPLKNSTFGTSTIDTLLKYIQELVQTFLFRYLVAILMSGTEDD